MSLVGHSHRFGLVRFRVDCVAKLDDEPLARNNRIVAHRFLNQHCALASALESILLVLAPKIVLQHNRVHCGHEFLRQGRDGTSRSRGGRRRCPRDGGEVAYSSVFFASCSYGFCCRSMRSAWSARPIQRAAISTIAALSLGLLICRERVRKYCALRRHSPAFMSPLPRIGFRRQRTNNGGSESVPGSVILWRRMDFRLSAIPHPASIDPHAGEARLGSSVRGLRLGLSVRQQVDGQSNYGRSQNP
jgi:hypothetical protein